MQRGLPASDTRWFPSSHRKIKPIVSRARARPHRSKNDRVATGPLRTGAREQLGGSQTSKLKVLGAVHGQGTQLTRGGCLHFREDIGIELGATQDRVGVRRNATWDVVVVYASEQSETFRHEFIRFD